MRVLPENVVHRGGGQHETLERLLCAAPTESYAAASRLVATGTVRIDEPVLVLVVSGGALRLEGVARVAAGIALQEFAVASGERRVLHVVRDDHAICLIAGGDAAALARRGAALGELLKGSLERAWGGRPQTVVGVGGVRATLADAARSYTQAHWAARVAERLPGTAAVRRWDDLGVFQLLRTVEPSDELPASLEALLGCPNAPMLLETLEVYLDTGGDARATAARLCLARGSLYYRLRRIEEVAGVDLRDGGERLTLHLGLKLARLSGRWDEAAPAALPLVG